MANPWDINLANFQPEDPLQYLMAKPSDPRAQVIVPTKKKPVVARKASADLALPPQNKPVAPKGAVVSTPAAIAPSMKVDQQSQTDAQTLQNKNGTEATDQGKYSTSKGLFATPDEVNPVFDMIRGLPEFQAQSQGVDDLAAAIKNLKSAPAGKTEGWIKPLLALADSETGSKLMAGFTEPKAAKDQNELLLKYEDALQKRRNDLSDNLIDSASKFKTGTSLEQVLLGNKATTGLMEQAQSQQVQREGYKPVLRGRSGKPGDDLTPLEKSADVAFGKGLAEWQSSGGFTNVDKNIAKIEGAIRYLNKQKGGVIGASGTTQGLLAATGLQKIFDPGAAKIKQDMDTVATEGLKGLLPGAVSDYESKMIQRLTYDSSLPESENIKKLQAAMAVLKKGRKRTQELIDYSTKNRSIRGAGTMQDAGGSGGGESREAKIARLKALKAGK